MKEQQHGVLLMIAGLSMRIGGAAIQPSALKVWLDEQAACGIVERETLWLFRTGYLTTSDGEGYVVTDAGWKALDQHMLEKDAMARREEAVTGELSPDGAVDRANDELPDTLILMGEFQIKAEAQRMTMRAFPTTAPSRQR